MRRNDHTQRRRLNSGKTADAFERLLIKLLALLFVQTRAVSPSKREQILCGKPGSKVSACRKLRTNNPALTNKTSDIANCAITSTSRKAIDAAVDRKHLPRL